MRTSSNSSASFFVLKTSLSLDMKTRRMWLTILTPFIRNNFAWLLAGGCPPLLNLNWGGEQVGYLVISYFSIQLDGQLNKLIDYICGITRTMFFFFILLLDLHTGNFWHVYIAYAVGYGVCVWGNCYECCWPLWHYMLVKMLRCFNLVTDDILSNLKRYLNIYDIIKFQKC